MDEPSVLSRPIGSITFCCAGPRIPIGVIADPFQPSLREFFFFFFCAASVQIPVTSSDSNSNYLLLLLCFASREQLLALNTTTENIFLCELHKTDGLHLAPVRRKKRRTKANLCELTADSRLHGSDFTVCPLDQLSFHPSLDPPYSSIKPSSIYLSNHTHPNISHSSIIPPSIICFF